MDLAVFLEDFSVSPKRTYEKRFPIGIVDEPTVVAPVATGPAFVLEPDGTLVTGRDLDLTAVQDWNLKVRINGFGVGFDDSEVEIAATGNPNTPLQIVALDSFQRRTDGLRLMGRILDMGGEANSTEYGFIIAARPDPDLTDPTAQIIPVSGQFGAFEHMLPVDANYHNQYFRAYAMNGEGVSYGASYRIVAPDSILALGWTGANRITGAPGWWTSPWFGEFYRVGDSGWMLHAELGWIFAAGQNTNAGIWIWLEKMGWMWTNSSIYPFLYQNDQNNWLFFHGQGRGSLIFYDYQTNHWMSVDLD